MVGWWGFVLCCISGWWFWVGDWCVGWFVVFCLCLDVLLVVLVGVGDFWYCCWVWGRVFCWLFVGFLVYWWLVLGWWLGWVGRSGLVFFWLGCVNGFFVRLGLIVLFVVWLGLLFVVCVYVLVIGVVFWWLAGVWLISWLAGLVSFGYKLLGCWCVWCGLVALFGFGRLVVLWFSYVFWVWYYRCDLVWLIFFCCSGVVSWCVVGVVFGLDGGSLVCVVILDGYGWWWVELLGDGLVGVVGNVGLGCVCSYSVLVVRFWLLWWCRIG